jgi:hypothetical protein
MIVAWWFGGAITWDVLLTQERMQSMVAEGYVEPDQINTAAHVGAAMFVSIPGYMAGFVWPVFLYLTKAGQMLTAGGYKETITTYALISGALPLTLVVVGAIIRAAVYAWR